jgi:glycerol kinase
LPFKCNLQRYSAAHVTDATNAARTMLMDLETLTWHAPTLAVGLYKLKSVYPQRFESAWVFNP